MGIIITPFLSDGHPASVCPGIVSCGKSALILTDSVCIQTRKLRCLLVSVTLLKEFQAFLTFLVRNPVTEGRCSFFHAVLHIWEPNCFSPHTQLSFRLCCWQIILRNIYCKKSVDRCFCISCCIEICICYFNNTSPVTIFIY